MAFSVIGAVRRVVGPVVELAGVTGAKMLELVEVGRDRLVGEIVRLQGERAWVQVYEDTTGLTPGEEAYGSGLPLSVELGPGLMGAIFDGIQRPLERIRNASDQYVRRGIHLDVLRRDVKWPFAPALKEGAEVGPGTVLGTVPETGMIEHRVLAPPGVSGCLTMIAREGAYTIEDPIARVERDGAATDVWLVHSWPVRRPRPYAEKLVLGDPLITGQRVIDTLFPVAKGGTVAVPGGFGTGKTIAQHALAKWCDADLIVFIGCGERGNEITDLLIEFPKLIDPRSGRSMMERSIIIANTSNMPVAAREACIYTGITLAEYYRDMGYHVAVLADSTSRWAEALRELSSRMEEMPAEEGFPSYLATRLAEFYERAGRVRTLAGSEGSVTCIGSISPPGGDFSEPVTQHTKRFVRAFWALDRDLAYARHFPAVSWLDSYSEYVDQITPWWETHVSDEWRSMRGLIIELLQREAKLQQVVKLVGPDVLPDSQRLVLDVCALFKNAFLQQSAFDAVDAYSVAPKQIRMLKIITAYSQRGAEAIRRGATLVRLRQLAVYDEMLRMKYSVPNDQPERLDTLLARLHEAMDQLTATYEPRERPSPRQA